MRARGRAMCPPPNTNMRFLGMKCSTIIVWVTVRSMNSEFSVPRLFLQPEAASPVWSICAASPFTQVVTMTASSPRFKACSICAYIYLMRIPPIICVDVRKNIISADFWQKDFGKEL
jgi:rubredoxin